MPPTAVASLDIIVPEGMQPGQLIQAQSPDGTIVQATIPTSVQPGGAFTVEYTPVAQPAASGEGKVLYTHRDLLILASLVLAGLVLPFFRTSVGTLLHVIASYLLPTAIAGVAVAYDWGTYGPTVALKHGVISAAAAWILVVPFGFMTDSLLLAFSWLLLYVGGFLVIATLVGGFGAVGILLGLAVLLFLVTCGGLAVSLIQGPLGHTLIFIVVFWCVRLYMGLILPSHIDPRTWPHVSQVDKGSEEFQTQVDFLMASCIPWEHKYDFNLAVKNLYRIDQPSPQQTRAPATAATGSRRLFHGTPWEAAMGIVCDGFRLPSNAGMFGKGLYFADCPLKCWRYCFSSKQMSDTLPKLTGRGGFVFMCWVDLGTTREEKEARPELSGYNRRGWWAWLTRGRGAYDSVLGVTEESGGALRVPEYIVYNLDQVRLAYMFEVEKKPSGHNPAPRA